MKKTFVTSALALLTVISYGQKGNAPQAVKTAFMKANPSATKVKYEKEGGNYEVSFSENGKDMSAVYDSKGGLLETEEAIPASELPVSVMPWFNSHYKGVAVKETARIVNNKGVTTYEVGTKKGDIIFDANGKFLKEAKN